LNDPKTTDIIVSNKLEEIQEELKLMISQRKKVWWYLRNSHPLFFALFPPIALYAINIARFPGDQIIQSLIVLVIAGFVFFSLGWLVSRDIERSTLIASLILFFSMNYGHAYTALGSLISEIWEYSGNEIDLGNTSLGRHIVLLIIWIALAVVIHKAITRKEQRKNTAPTFLFLVSVIAFLIPTVRILLSWGQIRTVLAENISSGGIDVEITLDDDLEKPDVYYIFLDGYGREDILEEFFNYDNSYFLEELEGQGFFVAKRSRSNYSNTITSLASSINMKYLEEIAEIPSDDVQCRMLLAQSIDSNEIMRIFRNLGYQFIAFSTGFMTTEITDADLYFESEGIGLNPFESMLIRNSILLPFFDFSSFMGMPFILDQLRLLASEAGPKFVFAHIVAPHPPFVFDADGIATDQRYPFVIWDGDMFQGTDEEYIQGYSDQVTFLNNSLLMWLEDLLGKRHLKPIIILQGDHGPRSTVVWRSPSQDAMREATAILNAYYLPGVDSSALYDEISPVNTFRVVLNEYFNADLDLLEDRTFFMSTGCQDFSTELN
jgi:hypothetical protein